MDELCRHSLPVVLKMGIRYGDQGSFLLQAIYITSVVKFGILMWESVWVVFGTYELA